MATERELAEKALELAQHCLDACQGALAELAAGDWEALVNASRLVRATNSDAPETERTTEHVAFALLTAAFDELRKHQPEPH